MEQGLRVIENLTINHDINSELGQKGACEGKY